MKGRRRTALGIDIGPGRVSMALVERKGDEFRVLRAASRSISQDVLPSQGVGDPAALVQALRGLRRQGRMPRGAAAMGVSVSPLVLQMLDMPGQMPPNVREFIESELGQYVALSGKSILSDYCVVNAGGSVQRQLFSVAGEMQVIRELVRVCENAGLVVEAVEPSILAYARARCRQREANLPAGRVLVVEINTCQLSACLLRKGTLDFVRTRSVPTGLETSAAANAWLVEEIATMLRHCDCESPETGAAWEVDILVRDGAGVTEEVAESLRTRTGVLPRVMADCDDWNHATDDAEAHPLASMTALGLAMKRLDREGDAWKVNLLPQEIVQGRSLIRYGLTIANAAAILFFCMIVSLLLLTRTANTLRRGLYFEQAARKLYSTPALGAQSHSIDRQIAWAQHQRDGIKKALEGHSQKDWSDLLNAVAGNMPGDVCITQLWSADAQRLFIRGLAMSSNTVHGFAQSLNKGGVFESVSVESLSKQQDGSFMEYEMCCLMRSTL